MRDKTEIQRVLNNTKTTLLLVLVTIFLFSLINLFDQDSFYNHDNDLFFLGIFITGMYLAGTILIYLDKLWGFWLPFGVYLISTLVFSIFLLGINDLEEFYAVIAFKGAFFFGQILPYLKMRTLDKELKGLEFEESEN